MNCLLIYVENYVEFVRENNVVKIITVNFSVSDHWNKGDEATAAGLSILHTSDKHTAQRSHS